MNTQNNKLDLTKTAFEAAKLAGNADGLTYAAWRAREKQAAAALETPAVETLDASQVATVDTMDTATVIDHIDTAIATVAQHQATVVAETTVSKSKLAQAIFAEELAKQNATGVAMVRKDVIKRFILEAGCTDKGAATYYQNIRDKQGLVAHKAA